MIYLVGILAGLSTTLLTLALYDLLTAPSKQVARQVAELKELEPSPFRAAARRRRQSRGEQLRNLVRRLGERMERGGLEVEGWAKRLVQAGYWKPDAPKIFLGARVVGAASLGVGGIAAGAALDLRLAATLLLAGWLGVLGWMLPALHVLRRRTHRLHEIHRSLADALDLLVACVEAGMGLNQALSRVASEVRHVSEPLSEELSMVNLEIRAGTPRAQALRNLAERTGLEDVESLVAMLVQTERFGTSIGQALRVQASTLRDKRRQGAEEAAAKTTIKLVFPLVLFVFPALFVVILGPAVMQILTAFAEM